MSDDQTGQRVALEILDVGDSHEFDAFYRGQYRSLLALAWSLTGRRDLGEELVQDALLEVHRHWDRVQDYDVPGAFARRVLLNAAANTARKRANEARSLARLPRDEEHRDQLPPDPEFWSALRSLPRRQAETLALHYLEDLPVIEIAEILGIAEGTVKAHLHRGRVALAERLEQEGTDR